MRIFRPLARAIDAIAGTDERSLPREGVRDARSTDLELFDAATQRGIRVHVTQDHHHRRPAEREAIARLGLRSGQGLEHLQPLRARSAAWVVAQDDAASRTRATW
jgi:hypothetical protein